MDILVSMTHFKSIDFSKGYMVMNKTVFSKVTIKFMSISLALLVGISPKVMAEDRFSDTISKHAIVMDMESNRVVYEKDSMTPTAMASLSKMMTLLLTFDALKDRRVSMNDQVKIVASDVNRDGTNMKLENGDVFGLDVLLDSMMIISANDSALAIARIVGKDYNNFTKMMNDKAQEIGMTSTVFYNPNGLPMYGEKDGKKFTYENTTCARDVMVLSKFLYDNYEKELTKITSKKRFVNAKKQINEENTNPILALVREADGLKTGFTDRAGYCLAYSSKVQRGNGNDLPNRLVGVTMGAQTKEARRDIAYKTLEFIKQKYKTKKLYTKSQVLANKDINGFMGVKLAPRDDSSIIKRQGEEFKQKIVYKRVNIISDFDKPVAQMQMIDSWGNVATSIDLYPKTIFKDVDFLDRAYYSAIALIGDIIGNTDSDEPKYPVLTIKNMSN